MEGCGRKIGPYPCCSIITGDARELAKAIPDESVDLIFTDPVYDRIEDYRWLGRTAQKILKPGHSVIAQVGTYYLDQSIEAMKLGLSYFWVLAEVYPFAQAMLWDRRITQGWKPYIWFTKGKPTISHRIIVDRWHGGGRYKSSHVWGDSSTFATYVIGRFPKSSVVVDVFTGGGVTPASCKLNDLHYLCFEIVPGLAEKARERVRITQSPLFVMEPEQACLL